MHLYPCATFTILDMPPAIEISKWYLSRIFPTERLCFVTPSEAADMPAGSVDLALPSRSCMTREQVASYLRILNRKPRTEPLT